MVHRLKKLAVLGSTGSIGRQTLEVVRQFPDRFKIFALAAGSNTALLNKQIKEFNPKFAYCLDAEALPQDTQFLPIEDIASLSEVDTVVAATPGYSGLSPLLAAVKAGKDIALANKESLVSAGEIISTLAAKSGARLLPIDSEHSAIWQCLESEANEPRRIVLTASGGPFRHLSTKELNKVTPFQALKHPSWQMGKKVTIDSATLMNKGLEVIEAHWLFKMPYAKIEVVIHPQSIIHSMVEFLDGASKAQLSTPDMRLPIQYALSYPERLENKELPLLDWNKVNSFSFEPPDVERFPCLKLAREAGQKGGTYPAVLCGADETAVDLFLAGRVAFTDIAALVGYTLDKHVAVMNPKIEEITKADSWARQTVAVYTERNS
jgi:1-deoxy-D-xylulose-5-phosphate reductoisomerase